MKKECKKIELTARVIVYREKDLFHAVCLDFNVFADGNTIEEVEKEIKLSVINYVKTVVTNNLDEKLLFRPAEKKYWDMFSQYTKVLRPQREVTQKEMKRSEKKIKSFFSMPLADYALCQS